MLTDKELTQSAEAGGVVVELPVIKLNLKEFVALRNAHTPPEITCHPEERVINQLLLLGLVEYKMKPPCPKKMAAVKENRKRAIAWFRERLTDEKLDQVISGMPYDMRHAGPYDYPKETKVLVATKAGVDLLQGRKVSVVMPKPTKENGVGCPDGRGRR